MDKDLAVLLVVGYACVVWGIYCGMTASMAFLPFVGFMTVGYIIGVVVLYLLNRAVK